MNDSATKAAIKDWTPPPEWRPYRTGNPGRGRVKVVGPDGKAYSRPRTEQEQAEWERRKKASPCSGDGGEVRLTIGRLAEALRTHLQSREKFVAVMDEAQLSPKAIENLIDWLGEWRAQAARREIERKELALKKLHAEIATLRKTASEIS